MFPSISVKNFEIKQKIGQGSYGEVYKAANKDQNVKTQMAFKIEKTKKKNSRLSHQAELLQILQKNRPEDNDYGFPQCYRYGVKGDYQYIAMDLFGISLQEYFDKNNKKMNLKKVLQVGKIMFKRIQYCHQRKIIHRDIKPSNFVLNRGEQIDNLYLVDFGLGSKYIHNGDHIPIKTNTSFVGNYKFSSIHSQCGVEHSRRDDIESIVYSLIYLAKGSLPWQKLKEDSSKTKLAKICEQKSSIKVSKLCEGLPNYFGQLLKYSRQLQFSEAPDYNFMIKQLSKGIFQLQTKNT